MHFSLIHFSSLTLFHRGSDIDTFFLIKKVSSIIMKKHMKLHLQLTSMINKRSAFSVFEPDTKIVHLLFVRRFPLYMTLYPTKFPDDVSITKERTKQAQRRIKQGRPVKTPDVNLDIQSGSWKCSAEINSCFLRNIFFRLISKMDSNPSNKNN